MKPPMTPRKTSAPASSRGNRSRMAGSGGGREHRLRGVAEGGVGAGVHLEVSVPGEVEAAGQVAEAAEELQRPLEALEVVPVGARRIVVDGAFAVQVREQREVQVANGLAELAARGELVGEAGPALGRAREGVHRVAGERGL